jgi:light-regulated signal transduction histidine kinase (bacteriophytochrome)
VQTRAGLQTVAFVSDITARKQAENELLAITATLERRVEERTSALEEANEELTAFAYSVSHDLRAPLRAIDGYGLALLQDYPEGSVLDAEAVRFISRMRSGTKRMGQLIEDLLNLSRVSRAPMERTAVDMSALARVVAEDLQATQPERQVEWVIAPGMHAFADGKLLRIVLENLIGNAWKFTSRTAEPAIEVSFGKQNDTCTYRVRDNGAGFDAEYQDKLFTPFQRLHRESEFPGTGIGLATVGRIVHRHGGRVWAEGERGKGATFFFTLGEDDGSANRS